jgi:hypothetical protein
MLYCHSKLIGYKAVRYLIAFHDNFYKFADSMGYDIVLTNSYLDNAAVYNKILQREGWHLEKGQLTRRTTHYKSPVAPSKERAEAPALPRVPRPRNGSGCLTTQLLLPFCIEDMHTNVDKSLLD